MAGRVHTRLSQSSWAVLLQIPLISCCQTRALCNTQLFLYLSGIIIVSIYVFLTILLLQQIKRGIVLISIKWLFIEAAI